MNCELNERFGVSKEAMLALRPDCTVAKVVQIVVSTTKEDEELVFQRLTKIFTSRLDVDTEIFRESKLVTDLHFGQYD